MSILVLIGILFCIIPMIFRVVNLDYNILGGVFIIIAICLGIYDELRKLNDKI